MVHNIEIDIENHAYCKDEEVQEIKEDDQAPTQERDGNSFHYWGICRI
jgi:hypothetical protein